MRKQTICIIMSFCPSFSLSARKDSVIIERVCINNLIPLDSTGLYNCVRSGVLADIYISKQSLSLLKESPVSNGVCLPLKFSADANFLLSVL